VEDTARKKNVLKAARALVGRHGNAFTISGLCEESGLSRSAVRRAFPTKAKLLEALAQDAVQKATPRSTRTKDPANNDDWHDRRFRILERAIASPEGQVNQNASRGAEPQPGSHSEKKQATIGMVQPILLVGNPDDQPKAEKQRLSDVPVPDQESDQTPPKPLIPSTSLPDILRASFRASEIEPIREHDPKPPNAGDAGVCAPPISDTKPPPPIDLPPFVDPGMPTNAASAIQEIATDENSAEGGAQVLPRGTVEPEVMRAILNNARSQVSKAAEIQEEQRLSDTDGKKLTIFASASIIAVGLIVGVFTSYDHFHVGAKTGSHPQQVAAHRSPAPATKPTVTIINATGDDELSRGQPTNLIKSLTAKAVRGDAHSQSKLAFAYLKGDGIGADPAAALGWSQMAASQGDASAQFLLATLYAGGVKPNPSLAVRWFAAAAAGGNLKAMHNLALAYLNGSGVSQDTRAAVNWFSKAASSGYTDSAFDLAVLYERGQVVPQDSRLALYWYTVAASQGDHEAAERIELLKATTARTVLNR